MKFKNVSPLGEIEIPSLGLVVGRGEEFDVPDDLAHAFAGQAANYEPADAEAEAAQEASLAAWEAASAAPAAFDPAEHDVPTVNAYLEQATPEERKRVLAAEADGKNRATVKAPSDTTHDHRSTTDDGSAS